MRIVVFGLTITSSFGNGHATIWRGLGQGLHELGHRLVFFERDLSWYRQHRDLAESPAWSAVVYDEWGAIAARAQSEIAAADVAMVTSYCPDAAPATELATSGRVLSVFYDLDTPVTLDRLRRGEPVDYLGARGLADFDLVLSYAGGAALERLRRELGARAVMPLYGAADERSHRPVPGEARYASDLSYLGTYAADRQEKVEELFFEPARRMSDRRLLLGGSQYPGHLLDWPRNVFLVPHISPPEHPAFYCSSPLTLSVTRAAMVENGWCPSGRLFEAAACGVPVVSDRWAGLEAFFEPGREILVAESAAEVVEAVASGRERLARVGRRARDRFLAEHTARRRAAELVEAFAAAPPEPRPSAPVHGDDPGAAP